MLTWSLGCTGFFEPMHAAQHLDRAVRDHLVGVHVRLRAGAGLPHDQREVLVELAVDHLLRGGDDGLAELRVEPAERHVRFRRGALDDAERAHDRHGLLLPADLEIAERALGLRAPIFVGGAPRWRRSCPSRRGPCRQLLGLIAVIGLPRTPKARRCAAPLARSRNDGSSNNASLSIADHPEHDPDQSLAKLALIAE